MLETTSPRWELYRALAEPIRLRLLALAAEEELAIGELAELLGESQPNVSRHAASLKQAGLVSVHKQGTRSLLRLRDDARRDPVVIDAVRSGLALCEADGSLARIEAVVLARDAVGREYFAKAEAKELDAQPPELASYLSALSHLLPRRRLAIDVGTGDGSLLEVLAPAFERVIALDRSEAQLALARRRVAQRGFRNVELLAGSLDSDGLVPPGAADVVFAVRVLHHAPRPSAALAQLAAFCAPGGALVLLDYAAHDDESMREHADLWLGFDAKELPKLARGAGFADAFVSSAPAPQRGPDAHLPWQVMVAKKRPHPSQESPSNA